jgi:hypothetical protein
MSALFACILALIVIAIVAIPLALLSKNLDPRVVQFIEGISKLVAAICVLQLSLKIPKFLGVYPSKKGEDGLTIGLSLKSIDSMLPGIYGEKLPSVGSSYFHSFFRVKTRSLFLCLVLLV